MFWFIFSNSLCNILLKGGVFFHLKIEDMEYTHSKFIKIHQFENYSGMENVKIWCHLCELMMWVLTLANGSLDKEQWKFVEFAQKLSETQYSLKWEFSSELGVHKANY